MTFGSRLGTFWFAFGVFFQGLSVIFGLLLIYIVNQTHIPYVEFLVIDTTYLYSITWHFE